MKRIPIFPLPGVVFFPGTLLPLHIFEPRYRTLVEDAISGDRVIGMTMLAGNEPATAPHPAIRPVGGAGIIVEHEHLDDGRINIVLEGTFRFRILRETPSAPYRTAEVEPVDVAPFVNGREERSTIGRTLSHFQSLREEMDLAPLPEDELAAERLSGELAIRLRYPPEELQELLEAPSLTDRFREIESRLSEWHETSDFLRPFRPREINSLIN